MGSRCTGPQTLMVAVVASRVFLYAFDVAYVELQQQLVAEGLRTEKSPDERGRGRAAPDAGLDVAFPRQELGSLDARRRQPVWKSKFYGAFVLNHRVVLHAIDATPARWRGDAGSSPLDRARSAASSPRSRHTG